MISHPIQTMPNSVKTVSGRWDYWRPTGSRFLELGTVRGLDVALPVHFHTEDQVTFVLSGRRRFLIGDELVVVSPGQGGLIPAGTLHRSLSEPSDVVCLNIYAPPGAYAVRELISSLAGHWRRRGHLDWPDLTIIAEDHRCFAGTMAKPTVAAMSGDSWGTVSQVAHQLGMSREGFTRQFKRRHGLPPHMFWLLEKLNDARRMLRAGEPIAAVAAETGFSDQSHLGRCFRRAFGVTPGRYRAGR